MTDSIADPIHPAKSPFYRFRFVIAVVIVVAIVLQYDAISYLIQNTETHHIHRMRIKKGDKDILLQHAGVKPLAPTISTPQQPPRHFSKKEAKIPTKKEQQQQQQQQQQILRPIVPTSSDSINEFLHRRSLNGRILLIPVNSGYLDFGLNLLCSLENVSSSLVSTEEIPIQFNKKKIHGNNNNNNKNAGNPDSAGTGYTFVAMDEQVEKNLEKMNLPVFRDPDMPFVSSKSAEWANPKFHHLVCTKLFPVLRALRQNISVVLSDADISFRKDPFKYFINRDHLDVIFSIGSCHRDLPDNHDLQSGEGIAKLNTGFYLVSNTKTKVVKLFEDALKRCIDSNVGGGGGTGGEGDQPAMNAVLSENIHRQRHRNDEKQNKMLRARHNHRDNDDDGDDDDDGKVHYGFFDGCLFANGCVYFKHLCANSSSLDPSSRKAIELLKRGGKMPHLVATKAKIRANADDDDATSKNFIPRDDPVFVHANFLVGKGEKIKHLQKYGLWNEHCISRLKAKMV